MKQELKKEQNNQTEKFTFTPPVDVYEAEEGTTLYLDIPGVEESSIDITLQKDLLEIKGNTKLEIPEGYQTIYSEFKIGEFSRKFTVNRAIDLEKTEAVFKNGKLKLKLPKLSPTVSKISVKIEQ